MGQAKNRGTFEERQAAALEKKRAAEEERERLEMENQRIIAEEWAKKTPEQKSKALQRAAEEAAILGLFSHLGRYGRY